MRRLFITGERFDSNYAKQVGLIDFVVDEKDFDDKIQKYVEILRSSGPKATVEAKNLVDKYQKMDIKKYKEHTVKKIAELRISKEGQEGISAFLEKRKSKWSE